MKTKILKSVGIGGAVAAALFIGCSNQSAQQEAPRTAQAAVSPAPAAAPAAVTNLEADPAPPILYTAAPPANVAGPVAPGLVDTNAPAAPAIEQRLEQGPPAGVTKLTPAVEEIVKMAQAGVSEEVMLSYVESSPHAFGLNSDGIVYLNDLGVGANVVTAMIRRDSALGQTAPVAPAAPVAERPAPATQTQMVSNVPAEAAPPGPVAAPAPPAQPAPPAEVAAPAQDPNASYFYDTLSLYGSWMYVGGYGWCWQPTVVASCGGWAPYSDAGRWYWSDCGWYWHSDYSWGCWAFHYGRWFHHARAGWMWCPDRVWGPAWVSWRYTSGYCGWAALPPAAHWGVGVGFTFYGGHVGVGFEFGLGPAHYAWVPTQRFCDYNPHRYCLPAAQSHSVYYNSTVINNYVVEKNHTVINNGVGRETVARHVGNELRTVTVRERPAAMAVTSRPERLHKEGASLVMERPSLPQRSPAAAVAGRTSGQPTANPRNASVAPGASQLSGGRAPVLPANRSTTVAPGASTPASPSYQPRPESRSPSPIVSAPTPRGQSPAPSAATPAVRSTPTYSAPTPSSSTPAVRSTPTYSTPAASHATPAVRSTPTYSTPAASHATPAVRSSPTYSTPAPSYAPPAVRSTPTYSAPAAHSSPPSAAPASHAAPSYTPAPMHSSPAPAPAPHSSGSDNANHTVTRGR